MNSAWMALAFVAAALVSALATPVVGRLALAVGAVDRPNERKVNRRPNMPLWGGLAVAAGFFAGLAVTLRLAEPMDRPELGALVAGGLLVLTLGAVDDRFGLPALPKLLVQLAAAGIAISFGFKIDHLTDPISRTSFYFAPWFSWLLTTGWIVVVTNSINLIDGLDGLCAGVSGIVAVTLTVISWEAGHLPGVLLGLVLAGAILGFLPYNFPPARIFIGDTGALFIGYTLSVVVLEGYQRVDVISFVVPLLVLAVPLLDTGLSIVRRIRRRAGIMQADREHIHHRLLSEYRGDHRPAVLSIYFLTACFCVIAVSFTRLRGPIAIVFMVVIVLLTVRILRNLRFLEVPEPPAADSARGAGSEEAGNPPHHVVSHASEDPR